MRVGGDEEQGVGVVDVGEWEWEGGGGMRVMSANLCANLLLEEKHHTREFECPEIAPSDSVT